MQGDGDGLRPRQRLLDSTNEAEYNLMPVGELGDDSITSFPFQVCDFVSSSALFFFFLKGSSSALESLAEMLL